MSRTAVLSAVATAVVVSGLGLSPALGAAGSAVPDARTIVSRLDHRAGVVMSQRRDEGPDAVVADGLCTQLAAGRCRRAMITKDASLLVFATASDADAYTGAADDRATALGRMVVSFGSPERVSPGKQPAYDKAVRAYRRHHPEARNDVAGAMQAVMRRGLPMRDAHADAGEQRAGLAASIPGAVDMVATRQVDVIVFASRTAAQEYAGNADDQAYRRGRVVLSFGNPALLGAERQATYEAALRAVLG